MVTENEVPGYAPLEVGDVLASTFRAIGARPATYFGLAASVTVPAAIVGYVLQVAQYFVLSDMPGGPGDPANAMVTLGFGLAGFAIGLVTFAVAMLIQAAMLRSVVAHVQGRELGARDAVRASLPRYFSVLVAAFVFLIACFVGTLMCIVPGVLAYVWLLVATPAAANEDIGPIQALQRSIDLTEGNRLTIFLVSLVVNAALMTLMCCVAAPMTGEAFSAALEGRQAVIDPLSPTQLVTHAISPVVNVLMTVVVTVMTGVVYAKLRGLRDQVDAGAVAKVFA